MVSSNSAPTNVTQDWFRPVDWEDYELETIHGVWYNNAYYGFYKSSDFEGGIVIDFVNGTLTTGSEYHHASHVAISDGRFRTIKNSSIASPTTLYISRWDNNDTSFRNYQYKSPRYILGNPINFKVAQLVLDTEWLADVIEEAGGDIEALNQTSWDMYGSALDWGDQLGACINGYTINSQDDLNGDDLYNLASVGIQSYVEFKVYADGALVFTKSVTDSTAFKLPRGFKNRKIEWEVTGMVPVKRVVLATSMEELKDG